MIREIKDHSSDDKRNKDVLNFLDFKIPCCHMEHDPAEADKLLRIQRDLDETKIILHKTIDGVLAQGEKLDSLVEKNSDLSVASQVRH
ncbi:VAMP-like protein YKT61 isoform X5 [Dioscorea cayenensis subsp. rotundata]|uniref:VAMP-like protein YKT61 isoform X5 n=1 Tax=Dioscorea cayennensis subsp. rotundata TaxID=55577 RepID=A0AB40B790_DIOCR|nr:VAMP-like protein YKT61 isoform X5 [Dioscorea cayenensis subsp. rotundata]